MQQLAPMTEDAPRYVTSTVAARVLNTSRSSLARWANAGLIRPAWRTPGGQARWDLDDLRRQLAAVPAHRQPWEADPMTENTPEPHPVAAAIVTSKLGVLAGQRNDGKPPWTFIAGEVELGESPADAAIREVKEETGLIVAVTGTIGRRVHPKTGRTMIYLACIPTEGNAVHVGDPEELAAVRWLTLDEADELLPGMFEPVRDHLGQTLPA